VQTSKSHERDHRLQMTNARRGGPEQKQRVVIARAVRGPKPSVCTAQPCQVAKRLDKRLLIEGLSLFASLGFIRSLIVLRSCGRDAMADRRRGRLQTYKRPCWGTVVWLLCPGPDSDRAAGLHPGRGARMRCVACCFREFACCRSDLSLSMPIASLCWECARWSVVSGSWCGSRVKTHGLGHRMDRSAHLWRGSPRGCARAC